MRTTTPDRTRPHGRGDARGPRRLVALVAVVAATLAGCSGTGEEPARTAIATPVPTAGTPAPSDAPTAVPTPAVALPDVPVRDADLSNLESSVTVAPASVAVPVLGIELPIDPVGVEPDGQMEIPAYAERAGWYQYGAAPGASEGTAVVAAHVDSIASDGLGPFARLQDLAIGDTVTVTLTDGTPLTYSVTDVTAVAKPEIAWDDVFIRDGDHRLVLVTCGGTFRQDVRSYSDNVIVTAVPVGS